MPASARWLDHEHYRLHGVWRLKTARLDHYVPLRCCHIRICRQAPLGIAAELNPSDCFTDVFRFAQTKFPTVLLEQLGPYWVIPSRHGHRVHIYLSLRQVRLLDPLQWVVRSTATTTRHQWRKLLRRALNK